MVRTTRMVAKTYSDATYVEGVAKHDPIMEHELEKHCRKYFMEHFRGVFFCDEDKVMDIYQEAFITLWEKIERRKIFVEDGGLMNANGKPFTSTLLTYFMSIAKYKNMEYARDNELCAEIEEEEKHKRNKLKDIDIYEMLYDDPSNIMLEIIADCISVMSRRCNEILTKFYYEEKTLDDILDELPSFTNKNALKTHKYKCMETLRTNAQAMYKRYVNG